jgi:F-type H+-transporting ATPase subunit a
MHLSPDQLIYWQHGFIKINNTIVMTWVLMLVLVVGSWLITRRLVTNLQISRWQSMLEVVVTGINQQIKEVGLQQSEKYIGFIGTLFLFIAMAAFMSVLPDYEPPTGSLSTTAAMAICVFVAVPLFGIAEEGVKTYLAHYLQPSPFLLPFNIIEEFTRTLALAVRLFGNMMSGAMILAILLTITPLVFPVVMTVLGLLVGMVQAYIFSILAAVYIAAAIQAREHSNDKSKAETNKKPDH